LTDATVDDATRAIELMRAVGGSLASVTGDAAYDAIAIYERLQGDGPQDADVTRAGSATCRRIDSSLCDQCAWSQISEISFKFLGPIGWVQRDACRACLHGENRDRQLRTIRQYHGYAVTTAYPHGPQRALHFVDVLIKTAVGQRREPRSQNRRRVGNALGLMLQYVREARKRNGGPRIYDTFGRHVLNHDGITAKPGPRISR
jgi:hypothetical protein